MTAEPTAPSPSSPEFPCSCGSGKPYADCCGAVSSAEAAPSDSRALPKLFLAIVTLGLLGAVAWFLNPPQPALRPAALRPQAELPSSLPEAAEEILPTSFTRPAGRRFGQPHRFPKARSAVATEYGALPLRVRQYAGQLPGDGLYLRDLP